MYSFKYNYSYECTYKQIKINKITHMFVHIPKYNYSFKCTNLLKTVIYV